MILHEYNYQQYTHFENTRGGHCPDNTLQGSRNLTIFYKL